MRILWMHDLSMRAETAGGLLRWLAPRSDAEVLVAHALGLGMSREGGDEDALLAARRAEAEAVLRPLVEGLSADGVPASLRVEPGPALDMAESLVEHEQIGLVIMGATGTTGLDRVLLGSTTQRLVRALHCSVLVARPGVERPKRVLCPIDVHHVHEAAILQAAVLARRAGAALEYITVVEPALDLAETEPAEERLLSALSAVLGDQLDPSWRRAVVIAESPVQGILHRANGADLVVMGTEGRKGWRRLLLGSVAEAVVQNCPVSVLVAR